MHRIRTTIVLVAVVVVLASVCLAQAGETGSIAGTVTDPQGAVVSNAKVSVTSANTGATRTATTNNSGLYSITNLLPGRYTVQVEAPGFTAEKIQVQVGVGSQNRADAKLVLAAAAGTTVEVSAAAEAVQVNTVNNELSETITSRQVSELPTLTRNPYALATTAGNVSDTAEGNRGVGVAINGQREASTSILLDGAENVDLFTASVGQNVPLDSVQEFSIITNNFTAEYGRASGGVVNVATKSGTNALHGTLYEFNRVSALAANTYENDAQTAFARENGTCDPTLHGKFTSGSCDAVAPKGGFTRNQFGYSIGGPIKKDKLFFFSSTEWTRIRSAAAQSKMVVTPEFLALTNSATQGFFAGVPSTLRSGANIVGNVTAAQVDAFVNPPDPVTGLQKTGPFHTLALANPTLPVFNQVNFSAPSDAGGGLPSDRYSSVARVDFNMTDKTTLYGRYAIENQNRFPGTNALSAYAGYDTGETIRNQNILMSLTHVFTPSLVTASKVTYNRLTDLQPLGTNPVGPTLYFKANTAGSILGTPVNLPGYLPENPGSAIPFGGPQNLYQFGQDLSWTKGKHEFRFGGMYIHARDNRAFGAYQEAVEDLGSSSQKVAIDNLLIGQLHDFQAAVDPQGKFPCKKDSQGILIASPDCTLNLPVGPPSFNRNNRYNDASIYAQDTWKFTSRLTLNLGLRWEYYGTQHNANPALDSNFYFGSGATLFDRIRNGSVQIADKSPIGELWKPHYKNFAPRVGFAWDMFGNGKSSLRGGYGISYERNFGNVTFNVIQNPPAYAVIAIVAPGDVPSIPITPNNSGPLAGTGTKLFPGPSLRAVDPNLPSAYSEFWSSSFEQQLSKSMVLSLEYSGSRGVHLYDIANINRVGGAGVIFGETQLDANGQPVPSQARLLSQYGSINFRGANGFSYYNGLNVGLRTTNIHNTGLQFKANYTWSHAIDNLSSTFSEAFNNFNLGYTDAFNPALDKGQADFDIRHRLVVSGIWDVPWLKNSQNAFLRQALGGFEFAPIFTIRTGQPYTIYDCTNSGNDVCARWAPVTPVSASGGSPVADPSAANLFNIIDMASAGSLTSTGPNATNILGNNDFASCTGLLYTGCSYPAMLGRNHFVGPNNWNLDFGIYKNFKVNERISMQFRGEMYNLFNHHNYYVVTNNTDFEVGNVQVKKGGNSPGSTTQTTATGADERRNVQLGLKLIF